MKNLILFLTMLFTLNVSASNFAHNEEIYFEQFNTVVVNVPAVIRCEYANEYTLKVKSDRHYLYDYKVKNDTLIINYKFTNMPHMEAEGYKLVIKHPNPNKVMKGLQVNKSFEMIVKSGNQKK